MLTTSKKIKKISTAQLRYVTFCNSIGGFTNHEQRESNRNLQLSILMANQAGCNIKIVFNTVNGYCELNAAIWGTTEKHILVKGGNFIPVESVAYVYLD